MTMSMTAFLSSMSPSKFSNLRVIILGTPHRPPQGRICEWVAVTSNLVGRLRSQTWNPTERLIPNLHMGVICDSCNRPTGPSWVLGDSQHCLQKTGFSSRITGMDLEQGQKFTQISPSGIHLYNCCLNVLAGSTMLIVKVIHIHC